MLNFLYLLSVEKQFPADLSRNQQGNVLIKLIFTAKIGG